MLKLFLPFSPSLIKLNLFLQSRVAQLPGLIFVSPKNVFNIAKKIFFKTWIHVWINVDTMFEVAWKLQQSEVTLSSFKFCWQRNPEFVCWIRVILDVTFGLNTQIDALPAFKVLDPKPYFTVDRYIKIKKRTHLANTILYHI